MQHTDYQKSQVQPESIGLFSGKMGVALYWFHCARVFPDENYEEQAQMLFDEVQEGINSDTHFGYADGLAGIGSTLCYLFRERFIELNCEDFFADFDTYFFNQVCFAEHTDLSRDTGIIGIGYYLLNRLKDMPTCDSMTSLKLRHLLLLVQDILFAHLGMNGYTYPFMKSEMLPESIIVDIKRFLGKMLKTGLCPELTRKAIAIIDGMGHFGQTVFAELEDAYNNKNLPVFQRLMAKIAESPEESPAKKLAMLQLQDMSLPPWWELF